MQLRQSAQSQPQDQGHNIGEQHSPLILGGEIMSTFLIRRHKERVEELMKESKATKKVVAKEDAPKVEEEKKPTKKKGGK